MFATYVTRGVKAGLVAGLAFGLLVALVANPLVAFADALGHDGDHETGDHEEATGDHHEEATGDHHDSAVSAAVVNGVSVVSGVLWGVLLGTVVFGIGFYFLEPAIPGTGGAKSYVLAVGGFVTASGAPWLALPPQPPGAEQSLPTETRLFVYGGMMVAGALVCVAGGGLYNRFRETRGRLPAAAVALVPLGLLAIPAALAPANPVTHSLPTGLVTGLTGLVVFGQALLWVVLAAAHARLRDQSTAAGPADASLDRPDSTVTAD